MLWKIDEDWLFLLAVLAFFAVLELAFRFGYRHAPTSDTSGRTHVAALQAALVGLLSLLLGFNFSMAASRFDARKTLVQDEVNAIRMTWLRAQLLPGPQRDTISTLLINYMDTRIESMGSEVNRSTLDSANAHAEQVERQLWSATTSAAGQGPNPTAWNLFIQALNEMISVNDRRRAALDNHVPETVINLLFSVAVGALAYIAYGYGLSGKRRHASTAIFALLVAMVLTIILDMDRPRRGLIRVDEQGMVRLRQSMQQ